MNHYLAILLQPYIYTVLFFSFSILIIPISCIALLFPPVIRTKLTIPMWNIFFKVFLYIGTLSKVTLIDRREEEVRKNIHPEGLYIANHQSFMDIPLLMHKVTIPPIMKKEVLYIPIFGLCAYSSGGILVDRKNKKSRKIVLEKSKENLKTKFKSLQYYPEGTRRRDSDQPKELKNIKTPLIKFAYKENIKVYPVSMWGTKSIIKPKSKLLWPGQEIGIILHAPVLPHSCQTEDEFVKLCWQKVQEGHQELDEKLSLG